MAGKNLVIIPARGGSKGIPRKNLRPLAGTPLIAYSIRSALAADHVTRVVVSTDDDEIAMFAERFGASVIRRPDALATDEVPLDPVILHAVEEAEMRWGETYEHVITVQPTSPFITSADIHRAIAHLEEGNVDTVLSAVDDRHLRWQETSAGLVPDYAERVNRQQLPLTYKETGAVIACTRSQLSQGTRIGKRVALIVTDKDTSIDIDSFQDLWLCEAILSRKRIAFNVIGRKDIGMGHVYRSLLVASELTGHDLYFVCNTDDNLAADYISQQNYRLVVTPKDKIVETLVSLRPDLVINDMLDTSADFITALKKAGITTLNFEDLGLGAEVADAVVNDLYPHQIPSENIFVGPRYFCLRDEFLFTPPVKHKTNVERMLITFGGVDENNLTCRVINLVAEDLAARNIQVDIITGPGYPHQDRLRDFLAGSNRGHLNLIEATPRISDYMQKADLAITSGGRTVLELASLHVPTVVLCQNHRETTHTFASSENGILNLGLCHDVSDERLRTTLLRVLDDPKLRSTMSAKAEQMDLRAGKKRVVEIITNLLQKRG